ncbi:MAG TPA: PD-(D/E)XK nuclease family protein [Xanthomonadaceae bacterium]|nr:PD-(D/E)XK nuclease family protein [Xanthomonadaceae bacterium]
MLDALEHLSQDTLFARLAEAADPPLVLGATRRLVQALDVAYARVRSDAGDSAWPTPPLYTLPLWLAQQWDEAQRLAALAGDALPSALSSAESLALWRAVVEADRDTLPLLRGEQAARLAAEAWERTLDFELRRPFDDGDNADVAAFNRWADRYAKRLAKLGAIDADELPARMTRLIAAGSMPVPGVVVLAGFDTLVPAQVRLLETMAARGAKICRLAAAWATPCRSGDSRDQPSVEGATSIAAVAAPTEGDGTPRAVRVEALTTEQELRAAARWARALAEADAGARIGIVAADLAALRADLVRVFDEVLCPARRPGALRPYNVSLGLPLSETAPVRDALAWLRWFASRDGATPAEARACLLSRFWGARDRTAAAAFEDLRLRKDARQRIKPHDTDIAPLRQMRLPADAAAPGVWSERISTALITLGWPGPVPLDSAAYQAVEAWQRLLAEFAALGRVAPRLGPAQAVALLDQLAGEQSFQPRSPPVPIQVLGALEAGGLAFDHLRILGMDEDAFPPRAEPHPLLPLNVQRQHDLPHATAAGELAFARRVGQRLLEAAPDIVVSHACMDGDRRRAVSPLFRDLACVASASSRFAALAGHGDTPSDAPPEDAADTLPPRWRALFAARAQELLEDGIAPPSASGVVPGGVARLADQAQCPFRGYARHHLGAAALDDPQLPLDHFERGTLAHEALARFWRETQDLPGLRTLGDAGRRDRVAACVEAALDELARRQPHRIGARLRALEADRLAGNIERLLALEVERPPFAVEQIEEKAEIDLAGIRLGLRVDRVDRMLDGSRVVIDYKTGDIVARFVDARPEAPQLPLYALLDDGCRGVAYAGLKTGQVGFCGVAAEDGWLPEVKATAEALKRSGSGIEDWDSLRAYWRSTLETLAAEVRDGYAIVHPKPQACTRCDLFALCRIREAQPLRALEDEGEAS